ncbi:Piso0_005135 [Millerozyma farinosa CBS 7064]|uniref:Piso0_005135 protein n=1 Tax=Pichia sorbitophila (strain ATCC MYA-4447 / BCRC 22081 / CBS 7064 / NBRC 10061 / NRRL Y-12695) TaxID=559304 RepID=G8Y4B4_PICSO|nr:Piso0_005135 [Millerozyma farinosa CBS 7064]
MNISYISLLITACDGIKVKVTLMLPEVENLINDGVDFYSFLDVEASAAVDDIRRQYRKKALRYHPDKNTDPGDVAKFYTLSSVYEILTDDKLREEYDKIRDIRLEKEERQKNVSERVKRFKEELEKAEKEHASSSSNIFNNVSGQFNQERRRQADLHLLKEDGARRRRAFEAQYYHTTSKNAALKYISYTSLPLKSHNIRLFEVPRRPKTVMIKWKRKAQVDALINNDVIEEIMSIFGPTKRAEILSDETDQRYRYGIVEYDEETSAQKAVQYDYRQSARLWDGTNVRKLASLLRECKFSNGLQTENNNLSSNIPASAEGTTAIRQGDDDYVNDILERLKK